MNDPIREDERTHLENLRAVYESLQNRSERSPSGAETGKPAEAAASGGAVAQGTAKVRGGPAAASTSHRGRNSALGVIVAAITVLAGKLKLLGLLASVFKFKTLATMLLSMGLYATQWGWRFALGFVLLIFVHELGHAIVLRYHGIPAGAPVFIPFVGAFITMRGRPRDACVEAVVAIGGPISGSVAAWSVLGLGLALENPLFVALGHTGALLNLFNLIPISPLDGGRVAGAFTRPFWVAGFLLGLSALVLTRSPILFLVLVIGSFTLWRRWRHPVPGYDAIPRSQRLAIGLTYAALAIALGMSLRLGHGILAHTPGQ